MQEILEFAPQIFKTASDKGFWDDGQKRNKAEMVELIMTELGEATEAHRNNHKFSNVSTKELLNLFDGSVLPENGVDWTRIFVAQCKNTVEDEMADAMIRILDYTTGWNITILHREYRKESTGNFAHDILRIRHYLLNAYHLETDPQYMGNPGHDWGYVIAAIIVMCKWYQIDLVSHMYWKMRYNETRARKHGKSY